jgi:hypothetical protein
MKSVINWLIELILSDLLKWKDKACRSEVCNSIRRPYNLTGLSFCNPSQIAGPAKLLYLSRLLVCKSIIGKTACLTGIISYALPAPFLRGHEAPRAHTYTKVRDHVSVANTLARSCKCVHNAPPKRHRNGARVPMDRERCATLVALPF